MTCVISNVRYPGDPTLELPVLRCCLCNDVIRDDLAGDLLADIAAAATDHAAVCRNRPTVAPATTCPQCGRTIDAAGCPNHPPTRHLERAS